MMSDSNPGLISLCTTCKGRAHHLKETLPLNMRDNGDDPAVEFLILDYDSPDDLQAWVHRELKSQIEAGIVTYLRLEGYPAFSMPHSRNVAFRAARGDILCNVDADNFIGPGFVSFLRRFFAQHPEGFLRPHGPPGTNGRIACRRNQFMEIGGYDEKMGDGWGYEDVDFAARLSAAGFKGKPMPGRYLSAIPHSDSMRLEFQTVKMKEGCNREHRRLSKKNIETGLWRANAGTGFGIAQALKNFIHPIEFT